MKSDPKLILRQLEQLILVVNCDFEVEFSNKETLFKNLHKGQPNRFMDIINPEDRFRFLSRINDLKIRQESKFGIKLRLVGSSKNKWYHCIVKEIIDGQGQRRYLIEASPIENLEKREKEIIEHEAALLDSEQIGHMGSWWVNVKTMKNHWSPGNYEIWGEDPAKDPPPLKDILKRIHPDDVGKIKNAIRQVSQTGEYLNITFRKIESGKATQHFLTRVRPWYDDGTITEVKGINFEITELVKAQEELEKKINQLSDHNRKLAEYIFINSHEVRRPMSNILGLIELAKNESISLSDLTQLLEKESNEMDNLIKKINEVLSEDLMLQITNSKDHI